MTYLQENLVEKAQNGDEQAFYDLLEPLQNQLYRMAYVYVQNENDAIDIFQQAMIRAYEGLPKLKEPQYFTTWMTRIVINCSKTYITKGQHTELTEPQAFDLLEAPSHERVEEELDLWQALASLDEKYKTVLLLRFYQDYTVREIAEIMASPEGTVKTNIRRGLQRLRQQLKGAYIDDWVQSVEGDD
ncbi:sigma-70 family RNA polymerase sigma factor [Metasolibacillus meyeri]|uniref:sigma-70 family RNA polymerase sigma factor n=1 Tax=Metasolibacillus meyeri TaxID=1071052 RepID=UPI000D301678|nr:sigma-70 family RNA polymerase sigma factor [Metasolibacillus meyeri]